MARAVPGRHPRLPGRQAWGQVHRYVGLLGLAVALLGITGVIIWWRKRRARVGGRQQEPSAMSGGRRRP